MRAGGHGLARRTGATPRAHDGAATRQLIVRDPVLRRGAGRRIVDNDVGREKLPDGGKARRRAGGVGTPMIITGGERHVRRLRRYGRQRPQRRDDGRRSGQGMMPGDLAGRTSRGLYGQNRLMARNDSRVRRMAMAVHMGGGTVRGRNAVHGVAASMRERQDETRNQDERQPAPYPWPPCFGRGPPHFTPPSREVTALYPIPVSVGKTFFSQAKRSFPPRRTRTVFRRNKKREQYPPFAAISRRIFRRRRPLSYRRPLPRGIGIMEFHRFAPGAVSGRKRRPERRAGRAAVATT